MTHPAAYRKPGTNHKAIAAFVLTLIGVVVLPFAFAPAGILLAVIARNELRRHPWERGRALVYAALVIGPLAVAWAIAIRV